MTGRRAPRSTAPALRRQGRRTATAHATSHQDLEIGERHASTLLLPDGAEREDRIAFRYCDASGRVTSEANPNGSLSSIAGIYGGAGKNILGLMPHPERMSESLVGGADGRQLFDSLLVAS